MPSPRASRLTTILLACLLLSVASGCANIGPSLSKCAGFKPIFVTEETATALTDDEVTAILGHNEHGRALGCW
jgi:hypothetical protein